MHCSPLLCPDCTSFRKAQEAHRVNVDGCLLLGLLLVLGLADDTNEELCARWAAAGAFYPFARSHSSIKAAPQACAIAQLSVPRTCEWRTASRRAWRGVAAACGPGAGPVVSRFAVKFRLGNHMPATACDIRHILRLAQLSTRMFDCFRKCLSIPTHAQLAPGLRKCLPLRLVRSAAMSLCRTSGLCH